MRLFDWIQGGSELIGLLRNQFRPTHELLQQQLRDLRHQIEHAMMHVPFYRNAYREHGFQVSDLKSLPDLARLPVIRRTQIQEAPEIFLSTHTKRDAWKESHTSGSTGQPLYTWFDPNAWRGLRYVLKARRLIHQGMRIGQKVLIVDDFDPHKIENHLRHNFLPGEKYLGIRQYLSVFEPIAKHTRVIESVRPDFIYGFPSYFSELASHWNPHLQSKIPLKALMTSSESVDPATRERLESIFQVPVLDVYGSTEFKEIAWQCRKGLGYHINMESVIVEVVDASGHPVPSGIPGEIVVTSLTNRAMPLIRYQTGDRGTLLSESCPCGSSLMRLGEIHGRNVDYVPIPELGRLSPYDFTTTLSVFKDLLQFKVIRRREKVIEVKALLRTGAHPGVLSDIRQALETRVQHKIRVFVQQVESIPRGPSGKHRVVEVESLGEVTA